jgi:hypothetical protein
MSKFYAFKQAAELYLATDQAKGVDLLWTAFRTLKLIPETQLLPTPVALFGSVLRQASVKLTASNLVIHCPEFWTAPKEFPWSAPTPILASGIGTILAAALANHTSITDALPALLEKLPPRTAGKIEEVNTKPEGNEGTKPRGGPAGVWQRRRVMLLAANAPQAGMLPAFGLIRNGQGVFSPARSEPDLAWPTLLAHEQQYASRIRIAEQDAHWVHYGDIQEEGAEIPALEREINPSLRLIDWALLCIELGLRRKGVGNLPKTNDPSAIFIRDLAARLEAPPPPKDPD